MLDTLRWVSDRTPVDSDSWNPPGAHWSSAPGPLLGMSNKPPARKVGGYPPGQPKGVALLKSGASTPQMFKVPR